MEKRLKNRDPRISEEKFFQCLCQMRKDFLDKGKILSPSKYCTRFRVSGSLPQALLSMGVIKKHPHKDKVYEWNTATKVDLSFAGKVREKIREMVYASKRNAMEKREKSLNGIIPISAPIQEIASAVFKKSVENFACYGPDRDEILLRTYGALSHLPEEIRIKAARKAAEVVSYGDKLQK